MKKNTVRFFSVMLTVLLSAGLTACGSETSSSADDTMDAASVSIMETVQSAPETEAPAPKGPVLVFEDNFDGDDINDDLWERCPEWDRQGALDRWSDEQSFTDGEGHLVLRAVWDEEEGRVYSGAVRTHNCFEWDYGYYEASIRFPVAKGIWGAFWMMVGNVAGEDNSSVDGVEIDIVESIHNENNVCNSALHWDGYGSSHQSTSHTYENYGIYDGEYHRFGLWRTEEKYIFYIDDRKVWETTAGGICPEDGYMKLTVEAADWAGAGSDESIGALPADMLVDYVRVWTTKPE
ncbi:MAG: glycoside hydrolase family 16 protein [Clostridia bacterium]|nr:glycoside hydrolase family 16 protein [Clostridia bacterium]